MRFNYIISSVRLSKLSLKKSIYNVTKSIKFRVYHYCQLLNKLFNETLSQNIFLCNRYVPISEFRDTLTLLRIGTL